MCHHYQKVFRTIALLITLVAGQRLNGQQIAQDSLRLRTVFNRDWRFTLGDPAHAAETTFDDHAWQAVNLPHSFSMPYFLSPDFYVGYGWYRKHFDVPAAWSGKRISIEFEGAFRVAEISVNGRHVGDHHSGYTGFSLDITDAVHPGDNLIAVRLNNLWNAQLAPRAGEHTFSGGIYRDVYLVVTDPLHVAWYGTFATTPQVSKSSATVNVKTEVVNESSEPQPATVKTEVVDSSQAVVAEMQQTLNIPQGQTVTFDQTSSAIANPQLWSPQTPNLYSVKTTVSHDGKAVDDTISPLGFRWFKFTPDQGFFLNGDHYYFHGCNVHQDHAGWGDAVTNAGFARDVKMVKDAGFDFIRGSHYPHDPSFSDACDRFGILFWSENDFWGSGGLTADGYYGGSSAYPTNPADDAAFDCSVLDDLRAMIRVHRNHPSVIVWSTGNEDFFSDPKAITPMRELLKKEVALIHELDPTRPAGIGGCQRPMDANRIDKLGDVAGYNGDGSALPVFQNPGIPSVTTEYGSVASDRPGKYDPGWGDLSKHHDGKDVPWRSGQSLWCAFDHGSLGGPQLGRMGIVDYFRVPKRAWYWYRNEYAHIPPPAWPVPGVPAKLKLEADQTTVAHTDGTDDVKLTVTVLDAGGKPISNSPPVTFTVVSGPGEFPTGPSIQFDEHSDISIRDGQAAIEFRSYYSGDTVIRATSPGLEPGEVTIHFDGPVAFAPGKTAPVEPRPYVRFSRKGQPNIPQVFGRDNPTSASSSASDHASALAADGNSKTFWQPDANDPTPSLTLDMERSVSITLAKISFPEAAIYHYKIEVSEDKASWQLLADLTQNDRKETSHRIIAPPASKGRYVRITFSDLSAAVPRVSEFEITGMILDH